MAAAAHGPVHSITTGVDLVAEEAVIIVPLLEWKAVVTATIIIAVTTAGVIAVAAHPATTRVKFPTMEADQSQ